MLAGHLITCSVEKSQSSKEFFTGKQRHKWDGYTLNDPGQKVGDSPLQMALGRAIIVVCSTTEPQHNDHSRRLGLALQTPFFYKHGGPSPVRQKILRSTARRRAARPGPNR
jgi:hypothetical protein